MNDYDVNDWGEVSLKFEKKGFKGGVNCYGTIKSVEKKYVLFEDHDGFLYLVEKKNFKFEKKVKPIFKL